ncbi:MAG: NADH-quinone oxidoreductase subunit A [Candidatus Rokubacteria bacterium]|nr:NADH-quinone oxidoreductase subunit A [Candidatus Rokubacteria bacterium]
MSDYVPVLIYAAFILAFAVTSLGVAALLRPSRSYDAKLLNAKLLKYECGSEPIGAACVQFPVGFYLVALVFLLFDVLAVFLFPWALTLRDLGLAAFWAMALFLFILSLGWLYAYREGMLDWK